MTNANSQVDCPGPDAMAAWLRETAANTREKQNQVQLTTLDRNLAPHVAFRLEQAADMIRLQAAEIAKLNELVADHEEARRSHEPNPKPACEHVLYAQCERHKGMAWTMRVAYVPPPRTVCPNCEHPDLTES